MQTLRLLVSDKIYDNVMQLLSKFKKEELEIITENDQYLSVQRYLQNELNEMNEGKASYHTMEELENTLESAIKKHENKG
ncbi:MAG: tRNA pseudouridine synthase A [Bacteroidota bacterium]